MELAVAGQILGRNFLQDAGEMPAGVKPNFSAPASR